ncbi:MAG: hypothetical protein ACTSRU_07270 [Candidatus Hodarchaeales archaeon]
MAANNRLMERAKKIEEYRVEFQAQVKNIKDKYEDFKKKVDSEKKVFVGRFSETKQELSKFLGENINQLQLIYDRLNKEGIEPYEKGAKKLGSELDSLTKSISKELSAITVKIDELIKDLGTNIDSEKDTVISSFVQDIKALVDENSEIFSKATVQFEEKTRKLTSQSEMLIAERVETQKSAVESLVNRVREQLESFLSDGATLASRSEGSIQKTFENAKISIETHLDNSLSALGDDAFSLYTTIKKIIDDKKASLESSLEKIEKVMEENLDSFTTARKSDLESVKNEITTFITEEGSEFDKILEDAKSTFLEGTDINKTAINNEMQKVQDFFRKSLYSEINRVSSTFEHFHHAFTESIQKAVEELQRLSENLENQLTELIGNQLGKVQQIAVDFEKEVENAIENVNGEYLKENERIRSEFEAKINQQGEVFKKHLTSFENTLFDKLKSHSDESVAKTVEFKDISLKEARVTGQANSKVLTDAQEKFKIMMEKFAEEQREFSVNTIAQMSTELGNERNDIIANLSAIPEDMSVIVDRYKSEIEEKFDKTIAETNEAIIAAKNTIKEDEKALLAEISQVRAHSADSFDTAGKANKDKISEIVEKNFNIQKEAFRKYIMALAEDISNKAGEIEKIDTDQIITPSLEQFADAVKQACTSAETLLEKIKERKATLESEDANLFIEELESKLKNFITDVDRSTKDLTNKQKDVVKNLEKISNLLSQS